MPNTTELSPAEEAELKKLNAAIKRAIKARRTWLDRKMIEHSKYQIGDELYDLNTGERLGVITGLYRYWDGRDDQHDDDLSVDYKYKTRHGIIDNTSRQPSLWYGSRAELVERLERKAARLSGPLHIWGDIHRTPQERGRESK